MSKLKPQARDFASPRNTVTLLNHVPAKSRESIAKRHNYDLNARQLRFQAHLRAWVMFGLTDDESLRDMHAAVNEDPLYELNGAGIDISLGGLSHAHATRPYEAFLEVLLEALARIEMLPKSKRVLRELSPHSLGQIADLLEQTVLFDSTTLRLPPKVKQWAASQNDEELPLKVHLRLQAGYGGIDRIILAPEKENDAKRYEELLDLEQASQGEHIYLHDCGYRKLSLYDDVVESGNHFVSRYHSQISFHPVRELSLPEDRELSNGYLLIRDRVGTLGQREDADQPLYRLINVLDSQGEPIVIVTSLLDLPVERVCLLYFYRWTIEIVFRWLKHTLSLSHLISHSPNGIMMQVVATLLVYALLVLYHQGGPLSLKQLLRQVRFQLHDRLYQLGYEQGRRDALAHQVPVGTISTAT